ncbi:MAG: hypothetical protein CM15mP103_01760 [Gammaproteobacteria bacterium]|nr:MAG: hypothetical protein CM15mP103_01760 [Gammaproteobacteria bacterium]
MTIDNATQIEFWNGETGHNWVTTTRSWKPCCSH